MTKETKDGYIIDFISGQEVKATPEEIEAVQVFARQLVEDYGYFLPFILVIISLLIIYKITKNQAVAGLISLTILIPYYIILYFLRKKMKSSFLFAIKH